MKSIYVVLPTVSSISTEFAAIKARYDEQQAKHNAHEYMYPVRKIICKGCGKTFYTIVKSKKYCDYYTCGKLGNWKRQRQKRLAQRTGLVCRCCGKTFTPKRKRRMENSLLLLQCFMAGVMLKKFSMKEPNRRSLFRKKNAIVKQWLKIRRGKYPNAMK